MSTNHPKISIIIPAFNEDEAVINRSLNSVRSQSFVNFECIIVDDSTNPNTSEACRTYCASDSRFKYIRPDIRLGLAASLNLACSMSKGEYIARFDSDDICDINRLQKQSELLDANPLLGVVGSWMLIVDSSGKILANRKYPPLHQDIVKKFIYTNAMAHPTVMFRRSLIDEKNGPYNVKFKHSEDLELWLRLLSEKVIFANIPEYLVTYSQNSLIRSIDNWKYNIKARVMHIEHPYILLKIIVLLGLCIWTYIPTKLRKVFYKKIIFN